MIMYAAMMRRCERSQFDLIRMSTRLVDDTRVRLMVPLRVAGPATCTMAEALAARAVR